MKIINVDDNDNKIVGYAPTIKKSTVTFSGKNNVLYCEENVTIEDSNLNFEGDNSLIYLRTGCQRLDVSLYFDSVCHCGKYNGYTKPLKLLLSEQKHCFIGDDCLFSFNVMIRNSDPHLIFDSESGKRINKTKSVFIGDHVWVGQYVDILKNTRIDSGSIVGASSVVAGKSISYNTIWVGNPSRKIKSGIFWDKTCVHGFRERDTQLSMVYEEYLKEHRDDSPADRWIYEYNSDEEIAWDILEQAMSSGTALEKCKFLFDFNNEKTKNRFVHEI